MAGLDISAYNGVLKEIYEPRLPVLLNSRTKTRQMFQKETGSWEGRHVRWPLNLGRNQGTMWTAENGTLPDAGKQEYVEHIVPIRFHHGRIQLSIQVMQHSRSNKGSWKRALEQEMSGLIRDIGRDMNRTMFGWGKGILALVNGDPGTGTTLTLDAPGGVAGATHGNRFLNKDMNVAFINPGDGTIRAGGARTLTAINAAGTTATTSSAIDAAVADNDWVVRAAKPGSTLVEDTAYDKEAMGLLGLVDDGTFVNVLNNVNRTTFPIFKSQIFTGVGSLSADILQRGLDLADIMGEGMPSCFLCEHSVRRAYLTLVEADRRYIAGDLKAPDAGTKAAKQKSITFGDIPWEVDHDCPYGMLFGLDKSAFTRWTEKEGEWADDDGTILMRLPDKDAYEGRYRIFENYSCDRPASSVRWEGISATTVIAHIF